MKEGENRPDDLSDEFKALGKELETFLRTLWVSEERKRVQKEVENGLVEVGQALESFVRDLQSREEVQEFKREVEEVADRFRTGEVQEKARTELLKTVQRVNRELKKASQKIQDAATPDEGAPSDE